MADKFDVELASELWFELFCNDKVPNAEPTMFGEVVVPMLNRAYAQGQINMRERAAEWFESRRENMWNNNGAASEIRALKVEGE